jgi:tRNA A58 N-methylase Trm61
MTTDLQEPSDGLIKVWKSVRSRSMFTSFFPHLENINEMEISTF